MRVAVHKLPHDESSHVALLVINGPDPTQNVRWRSEFHYPTRQEAYQVAVAVARIEFGVSVDELAN